MHKVIGRSSREQRWLENEALEGVPDLFHLSLDSDQYMSVSGSETFDHLSTVVVTGNSHEGDGQALKSLTENKGDLPQLFGQTPKSSVDERSRQLS